jgi:transposase InsO family protein
MKLYSHPIAEGTELAREDGHYTIVSLSHEAQEAILERHSDRSRIRLQIHELIGEIFRGNVRLFDKDGKRLGEPSFQQDVVGLAGLPRVLFEVRVAYCQKLQHLTPSGPNNPIFRSLVDETRAELTQIHRKDREFTYFWAKQYGYWTVYDWWRIFRKNGSDLSILAFEHPSRRQPIQRLNPEVMKIIQAILDEIEDEREQIIVRRRRGENIAASSVSFRHIQRQVEGAIEDVELKTGAKLPVPSFETIRQYASQRNRLMEYVAMYGPHVAKKEFGPYGKSFETERILQRTEMDFFYGDVVLVTNYGGYRIVLGIPHLSIIIDVFSRVILSIVVEFSPPNSRTVLAAIKQMLLPKTDFWERYPWIKTKMDFYGPPEEIAYDNAWVFESNDVRAAFREFNIHMNPCHIKTPLGKPHIESLGNTLNIKFHRLKPGYKTSIGLSRRFEYNSRKHAVKELGEFVGELFRFSQDSYSVSVHSGLDGLSPRNAWEHSLARLTGAGEGALFPLNKLEVDFKVSRRRLVPATRKGIKLDKREYRSAELSDMFFSNPPKTKYDVREDPLDLNKIMVVNPKTGTPILVPATRHYPEGMTSKAFDELMACKKMMASIPYALIAEAEREERRSVLNKPRGNNIELSKEQVMALKVIVSSDMSSLLEESGAVESSAEPVAGEDFDDLTKSVWGDDAEEDN